MASVTEIYPAAVLSELQRAANRSLMVAYINAELIERASLDVRNSCVFYNDEHEFVAATDSVPDSLTLERLAEASSIRYWSRGV